jgi:ERCC4-type nuclease
VQHPCNAATDGDMGQGTCGVLCCRGHHPFEALAALLQVGLASLPLGDYMWLKKGASQGGAAGPEGSAEDPFVDPSEAERWALAAGVVCGWVVERKTVRDLVGRSFLQDHLRQMARMHAAGRLLPRQLLLLEGNLWCASCSSSGALLTLTPRPLPFDVFKEG